MRIRGLLIFIFLTSCLCSASQIENIHDHLWAVIFRYLNVNDSLTSLCLGSTVHTSIMSMIHKNIDPEYPTVQMDFARYLFLTNPAFPLPSTIFHPIKYTYDFTNQSLRSMPIGSRKSRILAPISIPFKIEIILPNYDPVETYYIHELIFQSDQFSEFSSIFITFPKKKDKELLLEKIEFKRIHSNNGKYYVVVNKHSSEYRNSFYYVGISQQTLNFFRLELYLAPQQEIDLFQFLLIDLFQFLFMDLLPVLIKEVIKVPVLIKIVFLLSWVLSFSFNFK